MPINTVALKRRRLLLGFSQVDLSIVAGLSDQSIGRLERNQASNGGGDVSIDTVLRLAAALQMDLHELCIMPQGNKYETAVRFAHDEHSPAGAPKFHDRGRSVKAKGMRKLTKQRTLADEAIIAHPEGDPERCEFCGETEACSNNPCGLLNEGLPRPEVSTTFTIPEHLAEPSLEPQAPTRLGRSALDLARARQLAASPPLPIDELPWPPPPLFQEPTPADWIEKAEEAHDTTGDWNFADTSSE